MEKTSQIAFDFHDETGLKKKTHGGHKSNAKCKRPFVPNKWMHITHRSGRAIGFWSLLSFKNKIFVKSLVAGTAKKYFVTVGDFVNMGDHLHLKIKAKRREDLQNFLRVIAAQIARHVMNAKKGLASGRFWDGLIYSRVLLSAFEELGLKGYFQGNRIELSHGKESREEYLKKHNSWMQSLKSRKLKSNEHPNKCKE